MKPTTEPTARRLGKTQQAEAAFRRLMADTAKPGFYGTASLSLVVQDGRIQQVRLATESVLR